METLLIELSVQHLMQNQQEDDGIVSENSNTQLTEFRSK